MGSKTTFAGKTFSGSCKGLPRPPDNLWICHKLHNLVKYSLSPSWISYLRTTAEISKRSLSEWTSRLLQSPRADSSQRTFLLLVFLFVLFCLILFCFFFTVVPIFLSWSENTPDLFPSLLSVSSWGKKHKGNRWKLVINHWDFIGWISWETTISKKGPAPTWGRTVIIWILWVLLKHLLNPVKALSSGQQLRSNPKLYLSPAAQTLELVFFLGAPSIVLTNLVFILAPSDPRRWWSFLFSASQAHLLGTSLDQLHRPPKRCQHEDRRGE